MVQHQDRRRPHDQQNSAGADGDQRQQRDIDDRRLMAIPAPPDEHADSHDEEIRRRSASDEGVAGDQPLALIAHFPPKQHRRQSDERDVKVFLL